MSTQLEFIMQLYMMNLLQQQQQQQQQQQLQQQQQQQMPHRPSPSKREMEMDISSSTMTTATTIVDQTQPSQQQHQQPQSQLHNPRTHLRKNLLTTTTITNSSSSSSCTTRSPNSNSNSSIAIQQQQLQNIQYNKLSPLQQLLLGQLSAPPPPMLATTPPGLTTPSNLLLTPTTPNSGMSAAAALSLAAAAYNVSAGSQLPIQTHIFPTNDLACNASHITAGNFLQSSTVTSTPTESEERVEDGAEVAATSMQLEEEDCSPLANASSVSNDGEDVSDTVTVEEENYRALDQDLSDKRTDRWRESRNADADECGMTTQQQQSDDVVEAVEALDEDEEDEKPLASLLHSTSETRSLRTRNNVDAQNSSNSLDGSSSMPYITPTKQLADSTHYLSQQSCTISQDDAGSFTQLTENQNANITPMSLAKTLLTPPSSDQLPTTNNKKHSIRPNTQTLNPEASQQAVGVTGLTGTSAIMSFNTVGSLDAFLQNEDNLKNLRKVSSYLECENALCRQENLREHFHCFDEPCQGKILSKKDDIIRHLKWHKKRKESLLLGFARFSASDDCEPVYGAGCSYCWKQTHYHCVYEDCPKVYVSTSDVQMHANFHRKNSEIVQEGFRRFRAHENCKIEDCPFYGKKTSHYHCCREGCNHTFKNKADMDKHKSYHLRDYQLTQDGFKKILKTEACPFDECKFSTVCNHIHCVREGCSYILHSSSQMISHKRKHDRLDGEQAYQNFKKQKDSSGEDSPAPIATTTAAANTAAVANVSTLTTTPLSSLNADRFLARKRGRPPKKIELPVKTESTKRIKLEGTTDQLAATAVTATAQLASNNVSNNAQMPGAVAGLFPPAFLPNFNAATAAAAAAAAAQSMQIQDPNTSNMQLTHLMALFQLQNPLFYQNLYPGGMPANIANMLGAAAVAGVIPPGTGLYGNMPVFGGPTGATIKTEYGEKQQQYKE